MQAELEQLLVLQDRQQKIKQIQTEIRNLPLQRQNLEAQLAASAAALGALKHKAQHLEMDRRPAAAEPPPGPHPLGAGVTAAFTPDGDGSGWDDVKGGL